MRRDRSPVHARALVVHGVVMTEPASVVRVLLAHAWRPLVRARVPSIAVRLDDNDRLPTRRARLVADVARG